MNCTEVKDRFSGKKNRCSKNRNKSKRFTKETTQLPSRQEVLPSNHDRYELSDSDDQTTGADFALLANAPVSIGGHFQFKSDAFRVTQESVDSSSQYLQNLDADLLSYSLQTVPFHIRCGIESKYITEHNKEKLCQDAEMSKTTYEKYVKFMEDNAKAEGSKKFSNVAVNNESEKFDGKLKEVILTVKNLTTEQREEDPEKAELEDWLDDVLNS